MNRATLSATALAVLLVCTTQAPALTLTNRDLDELQLQIREAGSDSAQTLSIQPDQTLDDICESGCTIALEDGNQEEFEGHEVVDIQDGTFVFVE